MPSRFPPVVFYTRNNLVDWACFRWDIYLYLRLILDIRNKLNKELRILGLVCLMNKINLFQIYIDIFKLGIRNLLTVKEFGLNMQLKGNRRRLKTED